MPNLILNEEERKIIVFKLCPALEYPLRLFMCIILIILGFALQIFGPIGIGLGFILILAGNLLLLVNGYDNRVKFGIYSPGCKWEMVDKDRVVELMKLQRKMSSWDSSLFDVTNPLGFIAFLAIVLCTAIAFAVGAQRHNTLLHILAIDAAILFIPHWITGLRRVSVILDGELKAKIEAIRNVLFSAARQLKKHDFNYMMLLQNKSNLPQDIKFKVDIDGQNEDFLGYYGQVVINNVQGKIFPYFYVVLVAKKGYDLKKYGKLLESEPIPTGFLSSLMSRSNYIIKEFKKQKDVEVLVIRQYTTKQSGYHTDYNAMKRIFLQGLRIAEAAARKQS